MILSQHGRESFIVSALENSSTHINEMIKTTIYLNKKYKSDKRVSTCKRITTKAYCITKETVSFRFCNMQMMVLWLVFHKAPSPSYRAWASKVHYFKSFYLPYSVCMFKNYFYKIKIVFSILCTVHVLFYSWFIQFQSALSSLVWRGTFSNTHVKKKIVHGSHLKHDPL